MGGPDVRGRLMRAPWWVLSLVSGAVFAVLWFLLHLVQGESVTVAVVTGVVAGVFFGLLMGPFTRRLNRRFLAAMGDLPVERQREVRRAMWRGPAPADPATRRAAVAVVEHQLASTSANQWWTTAVFLLFGVLSLWLAVTDSWWWLLAVALWAGFLGMQVLLPRHLRARRQVLAAQADLG